MFLKHEKLYNFDFSKHLLNTAVSSISQELETTSANIVDSS